MAAISYSCIAAGKLSTSRPQRVCLRALQDKENIAAIDLYSAQRRDETNPAVEVAQALLQSLFSAKA